MNDVQLECFVKVADTLSFNRAAEELNMSQSSVSKQLQLLEKELNVRLLNRSTRRVELTAAGENFLLEARNILNDISHAHNQMASFRNKGSYSVRIGYTEVTELPHMSLALRNMRREFPNVYPSLRNGNIMDNLTRLEQGNLDVVLGLDDIQYNKEHFEFQKLSDTQLVLAVNKAHPLFYKKSVGADELKRFSQVLYIPDHRRRTYFGVNKMCSMSCI